MKVRVLITLGMLLVVLGACTTTITEQNPCIPIPNSIKTPQDITSWLTSLSCTYKTDEETTGYEEYYFSPAEFFMSIIPDVYAPGSYIEKPTHCGDCDDYAILTGYIMRFALGMNAEFVVLQSRFFSMMRHAIAVGHTGHIVHVFSLWRYLGAYESLEDAMVSCFPAWFIVSRTPIEHVLDELYAQGHVRCMQGVCIDCR